MLLWRSKRKNRISKKKTSEESQFAKAEMDADESQRPDYRMRELPKDMAHELRGETNDNELWKLAEDTIHEMRIENWQGNGVEELPKDITYEMSGGRDGNGVEELPGNMAHELGIGGW